MAALVLKHLSKIYGNGAVALEDLCLEVSEGELLVVLGPSGSGKSTALRLVAGLDRPTRGDIYIGGTLANSIAARERDIAMVFQDYALYPHFNVEQNLGFGLKMRRFPRSEVRARVMETAQALGIAALLDRKPRELSGGQRQRVALGRALVRKPKVFLFDEPLSNVDPTLRVQLRAEIKQIHENLGATMVYVTHDQHEAMLMGQRIAILRAGVLEQVGTPPEIYCSPANRFVAAFFGTPAINLIECRASIASETVQLVCGDGKVLRLPCKATREIPSSVSIGFRPEDALLEGGGNGLSGDAAIISIEALGGETLLHLEDEGIQFCARTLGFLEVKPGSRVPYRIPRAKLHLFDGQSGRRLEL